MKTASPRNEELVAPRGAVHFADC